MIRLSNKLIKQGFGKNLDFLGLYRTPEDQKVKYVTEIWESPRDIGLILFNKNKEVVAVIPYMEIRCNHSQQDIQDFIEENPEYADCEVGVCPICQYEVDNFDIQDEDEYIYQFLESSHYDFYEDYVLFNSREGIPEK